MVLQAKARLKKWGNSLGLVIPKEAAEKDGLRAGEQVEVRVIRISDITRLRGKYPVVDLQAAKEEMRRAGMTKFFYDSYAVLAYLSDSPGCASYFEENTGVLTRPPPDGDLLCRLPWARSESCP